MQNSLCVQVLRSPILAALPHISSLTEGTVRQHFGHVQLINVWHLLFACDRPTYRRHVRMSLQDRDDERCPADCTVGGRGGGGRYAMQSGRVNWKNCVSSREDRCNAFFSRRAALQTSTSARLKALTVLPRPFLSAIISSPPSYA